MTQEWETVGRERPHVRRRTALASAPAADPISDLAPELIEKIFSYLSLKEAIQTTILSWSWRDRWRSALRHLNLDQDLISESNKGRFAEIVNGVLSSVTGPIHSFQLFASTATSDIPRWVHHAITHGAARLDLTVASDWFSDNIPGKLPDSLFSCCGLASLSLSCFEIRLPSGFNGFKQLTTLRLFDCKCSPEGELGQLISNSPSLTVVAIYCIKGWKNMDIFSPCLRSLVISSADGFSRVSLKNCPNLEKVFINIRGEAGELRISDIFHGPCGKIQHLTLHCGFSHGHIPYKLPQNLERLRFLALTLDLGLRRSLVHAFCLLRSSPALEKLMILRTAFEEEDEVAIWSSASFLEAGNGLGCKLNKLRSASIDCSILTNASHHGHLEFCKHLLANSPSLHSFTIRIDCNEQIIKANGILKALDAYPKASEMVKFNVKF